MAVSRVTLQELRAAWLPWRVFTMQCCWGTASTLCKSLPRERSLAASCCNSSSKGGGWPDEPCLITVHSIPWGHLHSSASTSLSIPASCPWLNGRPWAERMKAAQQAEGHTWQPGASAASEQLCSNPCMLQTCCALPTWGVEFVAYTSRWGQQ